jgi:hypothetical protein
MTNRRRLHAAGIPARLRELKAFGLTYDLLCVRAIFRLGSTLQKFPDQLRGRSYRQTAD